MIPTLWQKAEEPRSLLMKVKEKSEKFSLNLNIQNTKIRISSPITSWKIDRNNGNSDRLYFGVSKITAHGDYSQNLKDPCSLEAKLWHPRGDIKKLRHYFANKGLYSESYGFSFTHGQMWELTHKEGWAPMNWCFWAMVLNKTLESPLDCKEIKSVNPKENQPWICIGRTDVEAEPPIFWVLIVKSWLIGKDPDAGKDWGQEEKGTAEMRWSDGITCSVDVNLSKLLDMLKDRKAWCVAVHGSQRVAHKEQPSSN